MRAKHFVLTSCFLALLISSSSLLGAEKAKAKKKSTNRSVTKVALSKTLSASQKIDQLISADYKKHKVKPNAQTSDELFLRRIYLDVAGRIPTYSEAKAFLSSKSPTKRSDLIDKLLDSEGFVSRQYNWWADLLRLQTRSR